MVIYKEVNISFEILNDLSSIITVSINPFLAPDLFLYPLETSKNL